jgi:Cft2 family RNA processing exonuclease
MFHYDRGLFLTRPGLAVDVRRRQSCAFVSHAHSDHLAPHQLALCTPATARLYRLRMGSREVVELPYQQPRQWGGVWLTALPAGHCLGSAMLYVEDGSESLLYTGDFKLGCSATAQAAELCRADVLIIESTYGDPQYRHPPREAAISQLLETVEGIFARGATPVIAAYALGKAQEVSRILTQHGIPVLQHHDAMTVSRVYFECGVDLGAVALYEDGPLPGHAVVAPPAKCRPHALPGLTRYETIAVTGWAARANASARLRVDHAVPLSDHADFDELLAAIERVSAQEVYCTHGPAQFVELLRARGVNAHRLESGRRPPFHR